MREVRVFAPAKINLYLDVLDKRKDGFHNIETIFEKIDLLDEIVIKEKKRGLEVTVDIAGCSQGKDNIVYKACLALFKEAGVSLNLDIRIKKRIPISAGLGGGSSDAASALKAINKIFELGVSSEKLFSIASHIGKDVPFFMMDTPFAVAKGTGERLKKINLGKGLFHILVKHPISLSTREMYQRIDRYKTDRKHSLKNTLHALKKMDVEMLEKNYYNIFENVLGRNSIHINSVKALLARSGAKYSLLSGSGPTVFCSFENKLDAEKVFKKIPKNNLMGVFLAKTYKGGIYGDNRG